MDDPLNQFTNVAPQIPLIDNANIQAYGVGTYQIQDSAVTQTELANLSVGTAQIQNASITSAKISSLTWDKGQGGTLTLGGSGNTNGVLSVKDSTGTEKVLLDNTGITISSGKMTIKDSTNTTIIDATGLVSAANFANDSYANAGTVSSTSSSFVDVSGSSLTFSLARASTRVLISFSGKVAYGAGSANTEYGGELRLDIDGSTQAPTLTALWEFSSVVMSFTAANSLSYTGIYVLGSGSHTIKLQWRSISGDSVNLSNKSLLYLVLGT